MGHPIIEIHFGGRVLHSVPFDREMLSIGRMEENDVVVESVSVSRHHAKLLMEEGRIVLEDQASGNGCYVNGVPITRAPITPEDEILLGDHRLVLRLPEPEIAADAEPESERAAPPGSKVIHAGLILQRGTNLERVIDVDRSPLVIGRSQDCDLFLSAVGVSRRHAQLVRSGDRFELEDLDSAGGTLVNGERIERRVLEVGDEITIKPYQLTFVIESKPIAQEIKLETLDPPSDSPGSEAGNPSEEASARDAEAPSRLEAPVIELEEPAEPEEEGATPARLTLEVEFGAQDLPDELRRALEQLGDREVGLPVRIRLRSV
jgi:pSer/pThr/pTyr-binding forkhead associated (FHA) protein